MFMDRKTLLFPICFESVDSWEFQGGLVVRTPPLTTEAWVQSLVWELRYPTSHTVWPREKKKSQWIPSQTPRRLDGLFFGGGGGRGRN